MNPTVERADPDLGETLHRIDLWHDQAAIVCVVARVISQTSFTLKQPKLEPKLVLALSKTKCLFRLFRFFAETASFGVLIEPKQKKRSTETKHRQQFYQSGHIAKVPHNHPF